MQLQDPTRFRI